MQPLLILFGAAFTLMVAYCLGSGLLAEAGMDTGARIVTGAALWSAAVFACCAVGIAYPGVFLALGLGSIAWEWRRRKMRPLAGKPPLRFASRWWLLALPYGVLYLSHAMAPEASFDGSRYHLGLVARYLREHGFHPIRDNFYAALSQGVEMLYLSAYAFGRHSAAAVVHLGLLCALAWQMIAWSRRAGFPLAGIAAALLVSLSPIVGIDGTSAYNDVAVAAIAFTLFHLLQVWDDSPSPRLAAAIGTLAGFAYAAKYTAFLAVPYGLGFVAWRSWRRRAGTRPVMVAGMCAAAMILPWMLKDWFWYHNPLAPFFNRWFPNPYVTSWFEAEYRQQLAPAAVASAWRIPLEVTTFGSLSGLAGPVFLLAPAALLALRSRPARRLLLAAGIFGAGFFGNASTRFLIPALPFAALAMCLVLARAPRLLAGILLIHAVLSWPPVLKRYCHVDAWHLEKVTVREALRLKPEEGFLESNLPLYGAARLVEHATPPGAVIFTQTPIPEAYTSRHIRTAYQSAANIVSRDILWSGFAADYAPTLHLRFHFRRRQLSGIRIVQTSVAAGPWSIHEIRVFDGARELPRNGWRATAQPFPWGIESVVDGRPASFWQCGDAARPGQFVQVEFGVPEEADAVEVQSSTNQSGMRLNLEGLADAPELIPTPVPTDMRRQAARELGRRGIGYLLAVDGEPGADDLRMHTADWGLRLAGESKGVRLYQLE